MFVKSDSEEANAAEENDDYYTMMMSRVKRSLREMRGRRRTMRTKKNPRNGTTKNETRCMRTTTSS